MKLNDISLNNNNAQYTEVESIDVVKKNSIFDKIFGANKDADTNGDGSVSFDEAIEYINKNYTNDKAREIILKVAAFLGVEKKNNGLGIEGDNSFYSEIIENIEILKKIDKNNDNNIDLAEVKSANNLSEKETIKLNRIFGIVDNKFNNKQGTFGTCHLLTSGDGIARNAPEVFAEIVKQNEKGDITVTFYGADGEPFSRTISNKAIQRRQESRARVYNEAVIYGNKASKLGSSDPDAIALELALALYGNYMKEKREQYEKELQNYIDNSEFKMVEKPSIEALTYESLSQEKLDELHNYYINSVNNEGKRGSHCFAFSKKKESLTKEQFDWFIKEYFPNSEPTMLEKPQKLSNVSAVENWIRNSYSETFDKPEVKLQKGYPTLNSGWCTRDTIRLLAGGTWTHYQHNSTDDVKAEEALLSFNQISPNEEETTVNIGTASFKNTELNGQIRPNHAYLINYTTKNYVVLTDPHDSTKTITYPIKDFLKNYADFSINTIPRKISK